MKQIGGKFLSFGTFGCVYHPNIPTSKINQRSPHLVSKIAYKKYLLPEKLNHDLLKKIDPSANLFITYQDFAELTEIDSESDNCLSDCLQISNGPFLNDDSPKNFKIVKKTNTCSIIYTKSSPNFKIYNMILPFAGQSISGLSIKSFKSFYVSICNAIYGIFKLAKNELIHYDLHEDNLMYDSNKIKLIDFGKLIEFKDFFDIGKNDDLLVRDYLYYPIEQFALYKLKNKKFVETLQSMKSPVLFQTIYNHRNFNLNTPLENHVFDVYLKPNKRLRLDGEFKERILDEYVGLIMDFVHEKFTYKQMIQRFLETFDVWSFCSSMTRIIIRDTSKTKTKFYNFFKERLHSNPFLRPLPNQLLIDYIEFLINENIITKKEKTQLLFQFRDILD
jgi:hypothetical protein